MRCLIFPVDVTAKPHPYFVFIALRILMNVVRGHHHIW